MTAPQKEPAGSERAIREALAAFPEGWKTVFQNVRERNPGVVEIGALWEDSDSLAEVVTVDTGNYYDNASAMPMANFIAACNPEAIAALLAELDRLRASQPSGAAGTPSAMWRVNGEPDPHAGHYDGERAALTLGKMTDDELANGAFLNYDQRLSVQDMINPKPGQHMPIVWMTAVKDRIRWLSRALERSLASPSAASQQMLT